MQIVNGGQTTASIYNAKKDKKINADLSKVFIQMKLSVIKNPEDMDEIKGEFDFVLINVNKSYLSESDGNIVELSIKSLSRVRSGGYVFIPKSTYDFIPNKRNGMETIILTLGLKIEVPPQGMKDIIIATKR